MVGNGGYFVTSYPPATMLNWNATNQVGGSNPNLNSVCINNGIYVAVGAGGAIFYSSDASIWYPAISGTANNLNKVIWAASNFIAVGDQGTILYGSTNGVT